MKKRVLKRAFLPNHHQEYMGIYRCVYCNQLSREWLPVSSRQLQFAVQFLQNPFLGYSQKQCPRCGRHQWLEKIVNVRTGEVILTRAILEKELRRLDRFPSQV